MSELRLNLGCGGDILEGWVNVDLYPRDERVVEGDIRDLSGFSEASEIRAIDVLEHIPRAEVPAALKGWFNALCSGGRVEIRCPDVRKQCELLLNGAWDAPTFAHMMFGGQDSEGNFHKAGFTQAYLAALLKEAGFMQISAKSEHGDVPVAGNANFRVFSRKP